MSHKVGLAKPLVSRSILLKISVTIILLIAMIMISSSGFSCSPSSWRDSLGQPRHPRAMPPAKPKIFQISVPLEVEKRSDWQNLSPGKTFRISHSGWLEMQFIDGEVKRCEKGMNLYAGKIKESIFRVRGEGKKATLYIEDTEQ